MQEEIVLSASEATKQAVGRLASGLPTFPAGVLAEGHSPGKQPVWAMDMDQLSGAVEMAIAVSRDELGGNGAEIRWPT
jgi:hypothetical protein